MLLRMIASDKSSCGSRMLTSLFILEGYGYMNKQQLFDVVKYYRDRKIPLDGLHIDVPLQVKSPPSSTHAVESNVPSY